MATLVTTSAAASGAVPADIQLAAPSTTGGLSVMEALWQRHSSREFAPRPLEPQDLSDLCFAASGVNRPDADGGKLTAPSALNTQEVDLYVFSTAGVYLYDPRSNVLKGIAEGDHRALLAGTPEFSQPFVLEASVALLLVANPQKFDRMPERARMMAVADAGIMSQNVCLFCAGRGLATVPRATMDAPSLAALLGFPAEALCVLNLPVGYPQAD